MSHTAEPLKAWSDPPYRIALGVFLATFAGYLWTLAPTVTFWDAGEFIAASKILGIPHPPGTPVFVFMSHVWADIVRIGNWAYRTNLMTATFSAAGTALMFLVVVQALRRGDGTDDLEQRIFAYGGAIAAAIASAFAFTVWQNSNETEVYMVAAFSIAAMCWLSWLWRRHRGTARAAHILLLIVYLQAFSVGNHLLTLLVGPAIIGFLWHVQRTEPLANEVDRKVEWAQWYVVAGVWAMLVGTGLGSTGLFVVGAVAFAIAAVVASMTGGWRFAAMVFITAVVGASTYYFIYLRAGLQPFINEADPSTFDSLLAVIRRDQYPPRRPWDNPIYPSGVGNPGRSIEIIWLQILQYLQYYDWQWSNSLKTTQPVFASARLPFTLLFTSLGIYGALVLREKDRSVFWMLVLLFLTTGPGLVGYMNFKPGFSLGWDQYQQSFMHEVRERDYFFVVSWQVWGLFAGIGTAGLFKLLRDMVRERNPAAGKPGLYAPAAALLLALIPFGLNFKAASRAHGPVPELASDFAYNLLNSIEPYGIVFTNGDNDTFPLWWAQEVEGIRRDVSVVNLSLGNTDWYIRQLRDNPVRDYEPEQAPWYANLAPEVKPGRLHDWTDAEIASLIPQALGQPLSFRWGRIDKVYPAGTDLFVKDILVLKLIQENYASRPIYFSVTAGSGNWVELGEYMTQHGLAIRLHTLDEPPAERLAPGLIGIPIDLPRTDSLAWNVYRYSNLFEVDSLDLDPTNSNISTNLSLPFLMLGQAYSFLGDVEASLRNFRRAYHLAPSTQLGEVIAATELTVTNAVFSDTALIPPADTQSADSPAQ